MLVLWRQCFLWRQLSWNWPWCFTLHLAKKKWTELRDTFFGEREWVTLVSEIFDDFAEETSSFLILVFSIYFHLKNVPYPRFLLTCRVLSRCWLYWLLMVGMNHYHLAIRIKYEILSIGGPIINFTISNRYLRSVCSNFLHIGLPEESRISRNTLLPESWLVVRLVAVT